MARALDEHRRIRDAVAGRDADGARQAMRAHMHTSRVELAAHLNPAQAAAPASRLRGETAPFANAPAGAERDTA
jgi:hypothetical protein